MAKTFAPTSFFKTIGSPKLLESYYSDKGVEGFIAPSDQTPKKTQLDIMVEFYNSLSPHQKYDLMDEFVLIARLATKTGARVLTSLGKQRLSEEENLAEFETNTSGDKALYYVHKHPVLTPDALILTDLYETKGYITYPTVVTEHLETIMSDALSCKAEFARVCQKETRGRFSSYSFTIFDGRLHMIGSFEDAPRLEPIINIEDGSAERSHVSRKLKEIYMVYHPDRGEIDVKYTGPAHERIALIECFLRTMLHTTLDTKEHVYDLSPITDPQFNLQTNMSGSALLSWRLTALTVQLPEGKRSLKLTAPKGRSVNYEAHDIRAMIEDLGLEPATLTPLSATFSFAFATGDTGEQTARYNATVTKEKCSLGNFTKEERAAKKILTDSEIDLGFQDVTVGETKQQEA